MHGRSARDLHRPACLCSFGSRESVRYLAVFFSYNKSVNNTFYYQPTVLFVCARVYILPRVHVTIHMGYDEMLHVPAAGALVALCVASLVSLFSWTSAC